MQAPIIFLYDFEIDNQSKPKELRKSKDESYTIKTNTHMPIEFALVIYYLDYKELEDEYFSYIGKDSLDVFVKAMNIIFSCNFSKTWNETNDMWWQRRHFATRFCYLCGEKYNYDMRNFIKVRDHCHYSRHYCGSAH